VDFPIKKILVVSVSAGNGHTRAAAALKKAADLFYPKITVEHVDFLDFVGPGSKKIFFESYNLIVKNLPTLYRLLFDISDNELGAKIIEKITSFNRKLNTEKFQEYIKSFSPQAIVFTHFTPAEIFNNFGYSDMPTATIITDYEKHRLWFTGNKQKYFVAQMGIKKQLIDLGVDKNNIIISGIPVDPDFYQPLTFSHKNNIANKLKISPNQKIVALMPPGQGEIDIIKLTKKILENKNITILALAGKDKRLLQEYKKLNNDKIKIIGWTDKISDYLQLADVVVTKPGGLTTSECLAINKPMVLINPIPGQEEKNIKYIVASGLGTTLTDEKLWPTIWENIQNNNLPSKKMVDRPATSIILDTILNNLKHPD